MSEISSIELASSLEKLSFIDPAWAAEKFFFLENWQWMTLILGLILGIIARFLAYRLIKKIKEGFTKSHNESLTFYFRAIFNTEIHKPIGLVIGNFVWLLTIESAALPKGFDFALQFFIKTILAYGLIKTLYVFIDGVGTTLSKVLPSKEEAIDSQLVLLATRTLKVFVILFGMLIFLQSIGLNVMSLLAGLGLGGLALALAAQDTAANLFGSITIIADKPFKVGDYIRVAGTEGTVEEIGFRSTRIRTLHQSILSVPNSTIAKDLIDNLGMRPAREIKLQFGLTYDTDAHDLENFKKMVLQILSQFPDINIEPHTVYFHSMGDFSLNVMVRFLIQTQDTVHEILTKEKILFQILKSANEKNFKFAFPTQTIHVMK